MSKQFVDLHCECGQDACNLLIRVDARFYLRRTNNENFLIAAEHAKPGDTMVTPKIYMRTVEIIEKKS